MPQTREHMVLARQVACPHRGGPQQGRHRGRPRAPLTGRARGPRHAHPVRLPGRRGTGRAGVGDRGPGRRPAVGGFGCRAPRHRRPLRPRPRASPRPSVLDVGRERDDHLRPRRGRHRRGRPRDRRGRRPGRDRRSRPDPPDGGHEHRVVPQDRRPDHGRRQHRHARWVASSAARSSAATSSEHPARSPRTPGSRRSSMRCAPRKAGGTSRSSAATGPSSSFAPPTSTAPSSWRRAARWSCPATPRP